MRRAVLVFLVVIGAVAGCSSTPSATTEPSEPPPSAPSEAPADDSTDDAAEPAEDGVTLPEAWPSDVPLPNATLVTAIDLGGGAAFNLGYSDVPADEPEEYVAALLAAGFTEVSSGTTGVEGGSFFERDDWMLSFAISDVAGVSSLALTLVAQD